MRSEYACDILHVRQDGGYYGSVVWGEGDLEREGGGRTSRMARSLQRLTFTASLREVYWNISITLSCARREGHRWSHSPSSRPSSPSSRCTTRRNEKNCDSKQPSTPRVRRSCRRGGGVDTDWGQGWWLDLLMYVHTYVYTD